MKLLLDTHTVLWYTHDNPLLSQMARDTILSSENEIMISPASLWEIAIKVSLGKLQLNRALEEFIHACVETYQFKLLIIAAEHLVHVSKLPILPNHKDPFDRLLVSQAIIEGIPLISNDEALDQYSVKRIW